MRSLQEKSNHLNPSKGIIKAVEKSDEQGTSSGRPSLARSPSIRSQSLSVRLCAASAVHQVSRQTVIPHFPVQRSINNLSSLTHGLTAPVLEATGAELGDGLGACLGTKVANALVVDDASRDLWNVLVDRLVLAVEAVSLWGGGGALAAKAHAGRTAIVLKIWSWRDA